MGMTTKQHGHGHHGHHTGPTHEPNINESFMFRYDAHSHTLGVKTNKMCYLYMLTADEQTSIHTSTGLHTIEKTAIDLIDANGSFTAVSSTDLNTMSHGLAHFCGKLTAMRLN
ncbi:uncharacterized protein LOC133173357 [Saccostrea echinata]|uniref:uncharacterized protein LOC133173357 n=1 Tax=Saccostrea echinata TaxID=191078 RepID=UPI002A80458E|nr:uncharacterized protein LOC133173357 [Saccostrea echinata]